ncbi:MAG: glutathione S-transferase family protein [Thiolinea sp.]
MLKIYGDLQSGNCYKVKLLLSLLGIAHEWQHIDVVKQETKTAEFLAINPNGQIPTAALEDGRILCESNALLGYFADGTALLPADRYARAKVYEWLFFEQYSHEPYIAVARFINKYLGLPEERRAEYDAKQVGGHKALGVMEKALAEQPWLAGETLSIADLSLYAYTHVAHEGGFDLTDYPNINSWCQRITTQPGYMAMP